MQKIMFNDKYGLTKAVLAKRKTQTRRIITNKEMLEIIRNFDYPSSFFLFYDRFFLNPDLRKRFINNRRVMRYQQNETVAIAQSYKDIHKEILREVGDLELRDEFLQSKGYTNKMFVRADKMPHAIRITNIRIERLQDISEEDCLKEGILRGYDVGSDSMTYWYHGLANSSFRTPQEAYASFIDVFPAKALGRVILMYLFMTLN